MLRFEHVTCRRGGRSLFVDAEFTIYPGQKVGLTGANGCGKSSLLAMVLGELSADAGHIHVPRDLRLAHVAQETPALACPALAHVLDGDTELREAEAELRAADASGDGLAQAHAHARLDALDAYSAEQRAARLLAGLGFSQDEMQRPVASFSGGWRMRLNLAQTLMARSDLLLLDEPTNHLDLDAVLWLEQWLDRYPGTLLLISHDRDFLDRVCDHIIHVEHQQVRLYRGNYAEFERQRAAALAVQQATYKKQQQAISDMERFVARFRAKATKARQAQSRLKALARMESIAPAHIDSPFEFQFPQPPRMPTSLLKLEQGRLAYGERTILDRVDLQVLPGDRIGLLGLNGAGKSTLLRALAGTQPLSGGRLLPGKDLRIGYFAQHQLEQLDPDATALAHLQRLDPGASESRLRGFVGGFGFSGDRALQPVGVFSGGEKARLVLAMLVYRAPQVLLLDEPTNHLDLEMRRALGVALQAFEGAMLIVAHDRHLLELTCDRFWLVDAGQVAEFDGDLDDYVRWLNDRRDGEARPAVGAEPQASRRDQRKAAAEQRARLRPLRERSQRCESAVEKLGGALAGIETRLADPATYEEANKSELQRLLGEQGRLKAELAQAESDWMAAEEALEAAQAGLAAEG